MRVGAKKEPVRGNRLKWELPFGETSRGEHSSTLWEECAFELRVTLKLPALFSIAAFAALSCKIAYRPDRLPLDTHLSCGQNDQALALENRNSRKMCSFAELRIASA